MVTLGYASPDRYTFVAADLFMWGEGKKVEEHPFVSLLFPFTPLPNPATW